MQTAEMNWPQQIDKITGASDHLEFIRQTNRLLDLDNEVNERIQIRLEAIQKRLNDENLYIAVVGRASTGKSTFVNALLGDMLLETGVLQMTTTMSTRVIYGDELAVYVQFNATAVEDAFTWAGLGLLGGKREGATGWWVRPSHGAVHFQGEEVTIRELITKLTTSDLAAEYIDAVFITYPADFLKQRIVLVDTPGADATNPQHKENTREAVAQADTAIIITPGEQAISGWLADALADSDFLRPFLNRCVFVLTRMDVALKRMRNTKRQEAIDIIYKDASDRLAKSLTKMGIKKLPHFYISSAQSVLDTYTGDEKEDQEMRYWQEEFGRMKKELLDYMLRQRAETISESVLRLIEDILQRLELHLTELWEIHNQKKEQLATTIHDLDAFCHGQEKQWKKKAKRLGGDILATAEMIVVEEQDKAMKDIRHQIFAASDQSSLDAAVNGANGQIQVAVEKIDKKLKAEMSRGTSDANKFVREFEGQFSTLYHQLTLIADSRVSGKGGGLEFTNSGSVGIGGSISDDEAGGRFWGGAAIGGGLALIFGLPFVVPIAIVTGLIAFFSEPSLDESKAKAWNKLEPQLRTRFNEIKTKAIEAASKYHSTLETQVFEHIKQYEKTYSRVVKKMKADQEKAHRDIIRQQAEIESILLDLNNRKLKIKEQREDLLLNMHE